MIEKFTQPPQVEEKVEFDLKGYSQTKKVKVIFMDDMKQELYETPDYSLSALEDSGYLSSNSLYTNQEIITARAKLILENEEIRDAEQLHQRIWEETSNQSILSALQPPDSVEWQEFATEVSEGEL